MRFARLPLALAAFGLCSAAAPLDANMLMAGITVARSHGLFQPDFPQLVTAIRAGLALTAPLPPRCDKPVANEEQLRRMLTCGVSALPIEQQPIAIAATLRTLLHRLDQRNDLVTPDDPIVQPQDLAARAGVGLRLQRAGDAVVVQGTLATSPARAAGIAAGERLLAIDGTTVTGEPLSDVVARLRGAAGSRVSLTLAGNAAPRTLAVSRVDPGPELRPFASRLDKGLLWLEIGELTAETPTLVEQAVAAAPKASGIVLDLRDNGGGLLDSAVTVAGKFLPVTAVVADILGRDPRDFVRYNGSAAPGSPAATLPVVVLVNGGTAAGAEIIAAALADNRRATLLGSRTHGLGTIQTLIGIGRGYFVRLTTHQVRRANGLLMVGARVEPGCTPGADWHASAAVLASGAPCPAAQRDLPSSTKEN